MWLQQWKHRLFRVPRYILLFGRGQKAGKTLDGEYGAQTRLRWEICVFFVAKARTRRLNLVAHDVCWERFNLNVPGRLSGLISTNDNDEIILFCSVFWWRSWNVEDDSFSHTLFLHKERNKRITAKLQKLIVNCCYVKRVRSTRTWAGCIF